MKCVNLQNVTAQDCADMFDFKEYVTIINDGKVCGFEKENVLRLTVNQRRDKEK